MEAGDAALDGAAQTSGMISRPLRACQACGEACNYPCEAMDGGVPCTAACCLPCMGCAAPPGGWLCDWHRAERREDATFWFVGDFCWECGRTAAPVQDEEWSRCSRCGKRLCGYHSMMCSGPCRACCGAEWEEEFKKPRTRALTDFLVRIVGTADVQALACKTTEAMGSLLRVRLDELGMKELCQLVDQLGEFVYSVMTCGLSCLADQSVVRVLMLINQGMQHIDLPMGLYPLQYFYMMMPEPQSLASEQMLFSVLRSFSTNLICEENDIRRSRSQPLFDPSRMASSPPASRKPGAASRSFQTRKLRVAFGGYDLLLSAPTPGLIGRSLQSWDKGRYDTWLVVRSQKDRKDWQRRCRKPPLSDFDPGFRPGVELWKEFQGRILCIYPSMTDEACAVEVRRLNFHVFFHINGYNYGHFWRSLLMIADQTSTMFIEMLSMASPLQTRELAHFTLASPCLLSQEQLTEPQSPEVGSSQATRERFILTDMLYPVDGFQLERQIRLGPPKPPNRPTAFIFTGGITRLNLAMHTA